MITVHHLRIPSHKVVSAQVDIYRLHKDRRIGGSFRKSVHHVGNFLHGIIKSKPSKLLGHVEKVLKAGEKYGKYIPGVTEIVPFIAAARPIVSTSKKALEAMGGAMVGGCDTGTPCDGGAMVAGTMVGGASVAGALRHSQYTPSQWTKHLINYRRNNPHIPIAEALVSAKRNLKS